MLLLIISVLVGYCIINQFLKIKNNAIMVLSGSFLIGSLFCGTLLYLLDLLFIYTLDNYIMGDIVFLFLSLIYLIYYYILYKPLPHLKITVINLWKDRFAFIMLIISMIYSFCFNYYTFSTNNGDILLRGGAWSDIMYHHSYIRSIYLGDNIPTTYPYFANTPIHYHFMFDYFGGKLSQFGISTVHSLNTLSSLSLGFLLIILFEFGRVYFKNTAVGIISPILLILHSSAAAFKWISEKDVIQNTLQKSGWLKGVEYEGWGLFNFNVFINQRHLAFSLAVCALTVLYIVLNSKIQTKADDKIIDKRILIKSISLGILIGLLPFWNAIVAPIIVIFLGTFGLAEFNRNIRAMVSFLICAFVAGLIITPQLMMFKSGFSIISHFPIYKPGYEIQNLSIATFLKYYYDTLGFKFILIILSLLFLQLRKKLELLIIMIPFAIANIWQMSIIQYDNNKLMIISIMFANCYAAYMIVGIYNIPAYFKKFIIKIKNRRAAKNFENAQLDKGLLPLKILTHSGLIFKSLAIVLTISLILAGIIDAFALKNLPKDLIKDKNSAFIQWIINNTKPGSIFLTQPTIPYSDNAVTAITLSGRMLYCVQNDVDSSVNLYPRIYNIYRIYTLRNGIEDTKRLIKNEGIDYILVDSVLRNTTELRFNETLFIQNFKLEYESKNEYEEQDVRVFSVK